MSVRVGSVVPLPVERVVLRSAVGSPGMVIPAAKEPYALIVRDTAGEWTIDHDAMRVTFEAMREQVPGLDIALAAM